MAAINNCKIPCFDYSPCSVLSIHIKIKTPISSLRCPQFFRPNFGTSCEAFTLPRLKIACQRNKALVRCCRASRISCMLGDGCDNHEEIEQSSFSKNSQQEAAIDLKLPRRRLLVTFTCNACGARSQRLINRLAYERGLVNVQCSGCSRYHLLVDNLGLITEYNLRDEIALDESTDHA